MLIVSFQRFKVIIITVMPPSELACSKTSKQSHSKLRRSS